METIKPDDNLQLVPTKPATRSKTVWFAAAVAVLSVLQGFVFAFPLPPAWQAAVGCAIAAAIVFLRAITNEPLTGHPPRNQSEQL